MEQTEEQATVSVGERIMRIVTGARLLAPLAVLGLALLLTVLVAVALALGTWDAQALIRVLALTSFTPCWPFW